MGIEAGLQRPPGGGHQHPVLGLEPGQGLLGVADALRLRTRRERDQHERAVDGTHLQRGRVSRVQVMIKHPADGRTPLGLAVGRLRQLGGVGAEQVMTGEPAGNVLGQQVRPGQLDEPAASLVQRQAGHAGRGSGADIRACVQPEQPEQPRRRRIELLVGPGEDGTDIRGRVPGVQRVQPAAGIAQIGGQCGQREPWLAGGASGGDAQRQGQPCAQLDQRTCGAGVVGDAFRAKGAAQQFLRLGVGEHIQGEG